jgi:uracil-DNA glycosylase
VNDLEAELYDLVRDVRTWVEWQASTGAQGLIVERDLRAAVAAQRAASLESDQGRPEPVVDAPAHRAAAPSFAQPTQAAPRAPEPRHAPRADAPASPHARGLLSSVSLGRAEREARLRAIAEVVSSCTKCPLAEHRTQTVFSRGDPMAELCFVGEGPGQNEDEQGEPFVGAAGQLLDTMIGAMGFGRDEVYVCNIVKCRPENNRTPTDAEMAACMPYITEQLELVQPKVIVALGATALRGLLGPGEGITKARGRWKLYRGSIPVMPTFHPSYVLRMGTKEVKGQVWNDLKQVLVQLGRKPPQRA